jgi:hypothetical protein
LTDPASLYVVLPLTWWIRASRRIRCIPVHQIHRQAFIHRETP